MWALAWLQEKLRARLKLKPAEPMGPGITEQLRSVQREPRIAPRETYFKNVLDILGLGNNKCKPMPDPDEMRGHSQTSSEAPPSIGFRQSTRSARRSHPPGDADLPNIATTWQVSLRDTEAWKHDTEVQGS